MKDKDKYLRIMVSILDKMPNDAIPVMFITIGEGGCPMIYDLNNLSESDFSIVMDRLGRFMMDNNSLNDFDKEIMETPKTGPLFQNES